MKRIIPLIILVLLASCVAENCTWVWSRARNVNGYYITGPNGKSIFLPAVGYMDGWSVNEYNSSGYYGSSSISVDRPQLGTYTYIDAEGHHVYNNVRYRGRSIRPVLDPGKSAKVKPRPKVDVEWVDLGLSVSWAACNLNATVPEASGSYFSWGEILPKSDYSWEKYKYGIVEEEYYADIEGNYDIYKYRINGNELLESGDDPVTQKLGQPCRMPTMAEVQELINNCVWKQAALNGVAGYTITGRNGNSIFLPAAGYMEGQKLKKSDAYGLYWTSELDEDDHTKAWDLYFNCNNNKVGRNDSSLRCYGFPVRPVKKS